MRIIFIDTETNGLEAQHHSVLSVAAIKVEVGDGEYTEIERYVRYYFPMESLRPEAVAVNGLTEDAIKANRSGCHYPACYKEDIGSLEDFCADAGLFVAHNIEFDRAFLGIYMRDTFCTCAANNGLIKPRKYPNLVVTAEHYGVEVPYNLHTAMADAETCMRIFQQMMLKDNFCVVL